MQANIIEPTDEMSSSHKNIPQRFKNSDELTWTLLFLQIIQPQAFPSGCLPPMLLSTSSLPPISKVTGWSVSIH